MFTIKSYKLFESAGRQTRPSSGKPAILPSTDVDFCNNILSKKDDIEKEFDIIIQHRNPFGEGGSTFIDLYKVPEPGRWKSCFGTYNIPTKEFILFYDGNKTLNHNNYIVIPSEKFFDGLEMVYYKAFLDI
jgi:hypothetical protein